jgi:uncharacterized membrane protein HdeD (DUF308 family)
MLAIGDGLAARIHQLGGCHRKAAARRGPPAGGQGELFGIGVTQLLVGGAFATVLVGIAARQSTALVLVIVVAAWAIVGGFAEPFAAFQSGETAGTRALFILVGLVSIAFGVVIAARPDVGAVTLALLFGLYSMIYGVTLIVLGVRSRDAGKTLDSALSHASHAA